MIAFLVYIMNSLIIPLINGMIFLLNGILGTIANIVNTIIGIINTLPDVDVDEVGPWVLSYIACLTIQCPSDDGSTFAPGCQGGSLGFGATPSPPDYFCGDSFGHTCSPLPQHFAVGLDDCIAFEMAKALNLFQFDFYNDWVNGSLFGFLLKYKKKKKGREVFCEYDCDDFTSNQKYTGVDGNSNGVPDNSCHNQLLLDTCFYDNQPINSGKNWQTGGSDSGTIRDGLIKKVGDEFYYAATTHSTQFKLFATDIISLGSVFSCDWQGIPKINDLLLPTSYKLPPDIQELSDDGTTIEACGQVDIGTASNTPEGGLFFSINCLGIHVNKRQCLNLRHICEIGVDIDQAQEDPSTGVIITPSDCKIGSNDIDEDKGKFFRDVFFGLNSSITPWIGLNNLNIPLAGYDTNFNIGNAGEYDFTAGPPVNGVDYINFRGYSAGDTQYGQTNHSYFFYFGLLPGKTGLDKMNQRFFTHCKKIVRNDILIQSSTTLSSGSTSIGTITFSFIGGYGPYTYTITGINPTIYGPITGSVGATIITPITTTITGLAPGTYLISGLDAHGTPVTKIATVSGPPSFYCNVVVSKNASAAGINDGEIKISAVGGGSGTFNYSLYTGGGTLISSGSFATTPFTVSSTLAVDTTIGYTVIVSDTSTPISACTTTGLTISGPTTVVFSPTITNVTCWGGNNGTIILNTTGGQIPYNFTTTAIGFTSVSSNMTGLLAGTYTSTVVDSLGTTATITNVITQPAQMVIATATSLLIGKQCDPTQYIIPFMYSAGATPSELLGIGVGGSPLLVQYNIDSSSWVDYPTPIYINATNPTTTPIYISIPIGVVTNVKIRFRNTANTCFSNVIIVSKTSMELPPAVLTLTPTTLAKQCVPNLATLSVTMNYLVRQPYKINYTIDGIPQTQRITTFINDTWTVAMPTTVNLGFNQSTIIYTVTDAKGCVATATEIVKTPKTALNISVNTSGSGPYTHTVTYGGGIAPLSPSITTYSDNNPLNPLATITDSVGCTA